jgi:ketosteroid isomerase-like protein
MSQENVEVARAYFEAWNAGDMDALREVYHPDLIVRAPEGWPEPGPFVGREAVISQAGRMREPWDADAMETIGEFIDAGDRIVVRFVWHTEGRGPGSEVEMATTITVRRGKIFNQEFFWDHAEALEAAGLSE